MRDKTNAGSALLFLDDRRVNNEKIRALEMIAGTYSAKMSVYFSRYVDHAINLYGHFAKMESDVIAYIMDKIRLPNPLKDLTLDNQALEKTKAFFLLVDWIMYNQKNILSVYKKYPFGVRCFFDSIIRKFKEPMDADTVKHIELTALFKACIIAFKNRRPVIDNQLTFNHDLDFQTLFKTHSSKRLFDVYALTIHNKLSRNVGEFVVDRRYRPIANTLDELLSRNEAAVTSVINNFWFESFLLLPETTLINSPPVKVFDLYRDFTGDPVIKTYTLNIAAVGNHHTGTSWLKKQ